MCQELGIKVSDAGLEFLGNSTYEPVDTTENEIYKRFEVFNNRWLHSELREDEKCIPSLFALPKLHKDPYKWRFIANGRVSPWKRLSKTATAIIAKFTKCLEAYCETVQRTSRVNRFWNIKNTKKIRSLLASGKSLTSVDSADFSTLYTNFPHDLIKTKLNDMVDFLWKESKHTFISIGYNGAYFHSKTSTTLRYSKTDVKEIIQANIDNAYIVFAGRIFRQKSGIVMGSSCSPAMATAALSWMEFEWCKQNQAKARQMNFTFRYIDDLITFNNDLLRTEYKNIYPDCLPLSFTTVSSTKTNYMDLTVNLGTRAECSLYDKRKDFNFKICRYVDDSSNVPLNSKLNTFYGELLRIIKNCDTKTDFEPNCRDLIVGNIEKGIEVNRILGTAIKLSRRYQGLLLKYDVRGRKNTEEFIRCQFTEAKRMSRGVRQT